MYGARRLSPIRHYGQVVPNRTLGHTLAGQRTWTCDGWPVPIA